MTGQLWQPPEIRSRASESDGRVFGVSSANASADLRVKDEGNLVMYDDATGSYWSQMLARAICGPERGSVLSVVPSEAATWGEWREAHPDGEVLLPPPESGVREENDPQG